MQEATRRSVLRKQSDMSRPKTNTEHDNESGTIAHDEEVENCETKLDGSTEPAEKLHQ